MGMTFKQFIGLNAMMIGGKLWQSAFDNNRNVEVYDELRWYEKIGYRMFTAGLNMTGVSVDEVNELVEQIMYPEDED